MSGSIIDDIEVIEKSDNWDISIDAGSGGFVIFREVGDNKYEVIRVDKPIPQKFYNLTIRDNCINNTGSEGDIVRYEEGLSKEEVIDIVDQYVRDHSA